MFVFMLRVDAVLAAILTMLLVLRLVTRRLIFPKEVYVIAALLGFCGWIAHLFTSGHTTEREGIVSLIQVAWQAVSPFILPLEGGLLGWWAVRSWWRWCFLVGGVGLLLLPFLVMVLLRVLS